MNTLKIAFVISQFNHDITSLMERLAIQKCVDLNLHDGVNYEIYKVPGVVEIGYVAKKLAKKKVYGAIIALGAVIRGDTDHYNYVCQQVSYACQKVSIDLETPVIFGVLTCDTEEQAIERMPNVSSAIDSAMHMIELSKRLV